MCSIIAVRHRCILMRPGPGQSGLGLIRPEDDTLARPRLLTGSYMRWQIQAIRCVPSVIVRRIPSERAGVGVRGGRVLC